MFQPIVDLADESVAGYEALARGPAGTPLEGPDELFKRARTAGRLSAVDGVCRSAAITAAGDGGLLAPCTLFMNVEPEALGDAVLSPPDTSPTPGSALRVIVEVTERALTARPAELLRAVAALRDRGWGIALDDMGADRASLALMPFLQPDVIKLDLRLVQRHTDSDAAEIIHAVNAESERSGAVLVAEGIETEEHLYTALAMGARFGQGYRFGRPGPLPAEIAMDCPTVPIAPASFGVSDATPFELVESRRPVRRGPKRLLLSIARQLEEQAAALGEGGVVLTAFQEARFMTEGNTHRYRRLGERAAFVGAMGVGMDAEPVPGVRGVDLPDADRVRHEWDIVVIGSHFAGAFVARDVGDTGEDRERRFDFAMTYDRDLAMEAARSLMGRITGGSSG